ncbi:3'-5' exonuclease [Pseudomonas sp. o96-267]|uniref:3'-5' exonuclease n=1 Tax=Pseudomonas sp. o96-267 TaxID=2479853 RepID=UPI000F7705C7|nr:MULTISPECIES: 3'-5' exonuclease [Pseudomonas]MDH0959071.1 3'-5' exonuclease [Pseudomonas chengduensis]MDV5863621.1 3'-5' exonuclease [Pseudomonas mendocina]RRV31733.1 3'-5' exonuclease [Pseudomonas sp. o96-267]
MAYKRKHLSPVEAIANGWKCRAHLKSDHQLMPAPGAKPAGVVWQGQGTYEVYALESCVPYRWSCGAAQEDRKAVAAYAKRLLGSPVVVLDVETTGLGRSDEVCEIAILDAEGVPLMDTLVRPSQPIPDEASWIHGISNAMVASAPSWPELAAEYAAIVAGKTVIAYSADFDKRLLRQTHELYGLPVPPIETACAMRLYAQWTRIRERGRDEWRWSKLIEAAEACGVLESGAHRALADARMALGVLRFLERRQNGRLPARRKSAGQAG